MANTQLFSPRLVLSQGILQVRWYYHGKAQARKNSQETLKYQIIQQLYIKFVDHFYQRDTICGDIYFLLGTPKQKS